MRDVVYYVATSADGFIARTDGSFDAFPMDSVYLDELMREFPETFPAPYRQHLGNVEPNRHFDTVLMGRATYEVGVNAGLTSPYPSLDQYVISARMRASPDPAVTLIRDDVVERVGELRSRPGKAIWLCGGGELASSLMAGGQISKLIIKQNPLLLGDGIPLFRRALAPTQLTLTNHRRFSSGHMLLFYDVAAHPLDA